jgi:hypothetical protein
MQAAAGSTMLLPVDTMQRGARKQPLPGGFSPRVPSHAARALCDSYGSPCVVRV